MIYYLTKIAITTALIVAISELGKRNTFAGALLASIPLVSVLAMVWLYVDTKDAAKVSALATSVFWLVLPSLVLFVALPFLLKAGLDFYLSLGISLALTACAYWLLVVVLNQYGVKL